MEADRKFWNAQQQALQQALSRPKDYTQAIDLFMRQHAHGARGGYERGQALIFSG
jgi:hypothetical protein